MLASEESRMLARPPAETATRRLVSLDAFRGAAVALMVLVNNPGSESDSYRTLLHSEWHGWTLADTVFPAFLWIVGVAITLSLGRGTRPRGELIRQILRRSAILFVLGLISYAVPDFDLGTQRILGVLQRIAICYLAASLIFLYSGVRGQILWIVGLFAAYWALMTLIPVPGYGRGRLDVEGNFAHYVDRLALGRHNYKPTGTWDPEGVVSTLPALATALFGVLAGQVLRLKKPLEERLIWLFLTGNLLLAAGSAANVWMPINKKLWTDSFALFMAGMDFVVLAMLAWLSDGLGRKFDPLVTMGRNAIVLYFVSEALAEALHLSGLHERIYAAAFAPLGAFGSLLFSLAFVGLMYGIAYGMGRRGWLVRV